MWVERVGCIADIEVELAGFSEVCNPFLTDRDRGKEIGMSSSIWGGTGFHCAGQCRLELGAPVNVPLVVVTTKTSLLFV